MVKIIDYALRFATLLLACKRHVQYRPDATYRTNAFKRKGKRVQKNKKFKHDCSQKSFNNKRSFKEYASDLNETSADITKHRGS